MTNDPVNETDVYEFVTKIINYKLNSVIGELSKYKQKRILYGRIDYSDLQTTYTNEYDYIIDRLERWRESIFERSVNGKINAVIAKTILDELTKIIAHARHYLRDVLIRKTATKTLWDIARDINELFCIYPNENALSGPYIEELNRLKELERKRYQEHVSKYRKETHEPESREHQREQQTMRKALSETNMGTPIQPVVVKEEPRKKRRKAPYIILILLIIMIGTYYTYDNQMLPPSLMNNLWLKKYHDLIEKTLNTFSSIIKQEEKNAMATGTTTTPLEGGESSATTGPEGIATTTSIKQTTTSSLETQQTTTSSPETTVIMGDYLLDKLNLYLNDKRVNEIGEEILGDTSIVQEKEIVWKILEWVDNNIVYDEYRQKLIETENTMEYQAPWETFEKKSGVCIDYAILTAALLAYADITPAYLIVFKNIDHAAVAVEINGTYFVLDQHLPPIEFHDYTEYLLEGADDIDGLYEITKNNDVVVVKKRSSYEFLYKEDYAPSINDYNELLSKTIKYINKTSYSKGEDGLNDFINYNYGYIRYYTQYLSSFKYQIKYPVLLFYHPAFESEWAEYMGKTLISKITEFNNTRYFWINLTSTDIWHIRLEIAFSNITIPNVKTYIEKPDPYTSLFVIKIDADEQIDSLQLFIYIENEKTPVAGITDEAHYYEKITTINADTWIINSNNAIIKIDKEKLNNELPRGDYYLIVWINHEPAYIMPLKIPF